MLREEINTALKGAMKAREEHRVSTLRLVNAALKNADLEAQGRGKTVLSDEEIQNLGAQARAALDDRSRFEVAAEFPGDSPRRRRRIFRVL